MTITAALLFLTSDVGFAVWLVLLTLSIGLLLIGATLLNCLLILVLLWSLLLIVLCLFRHSHLFSVSFVLFSIVALFAHSVDSVEHLVLSDHALQVLEYHLSGQESPYQCLYLDDCVDGLLINFDAVLVIFAVRLVLVVILLQVSLLFVLVDKFLVLSWGPFSESLDVE